MTKKTLIGLVVIALILSLSYVGYKKILLPNFVTKAILSETEPAFLPNPIKRRLARSKKKINARVDTLLVIMHNKNITLDQLLRSVDKVTEDQVYGFLDELNHTSIESSDQVFDIGKKHFTPEFDPELLRDVFRRKVTVDAVHKALHKANQQRRDPEIDPATAKAVVKQLLIEKEKKYLATQSEPLSTVAN